MTTTLKAKDYAAKLLDKLIQLDVQTTYAYYEMGQILHAFFEGKMYDALGYTSFTHLVEEELSFSTGTAHKYRRMFGEFRRLHYNKAEAIQLMHQFGITRLMDVLPDMSTKAGQRAINNKIKALDLHQLNFTLTTAEWNQCQCALLSSGAAVTENGRYQHSTQALMNKVREQNKKPKLKAVS